MPGYARRQARVCGERMHVNDIRGARRGLARKHEDEEAIILMEALGGGYRTSVETSEVIHE